MEAPTCHSGARLASAFAHSLLRPEPTLPTPLLSTQACCSPQAMTSVLLGFPSPVSLSACPLRGHPMKVCTTLLFYYKGLIMTWFSLFIWLFGLGATPSVRSLHSWLCSGKSLLMVEGNHVRCHDQTRVVHVQDQLPSCCALSLSSFLGRPVVLGKLPGKLDGLSSTHLCPNSHLGERGWESGSDETQSRQTPSCPVA